MDEPFYCAFPEFSDIALDGSLTAWPQRAKYNLPLDSQLLPLGREILSRDFTQDVWQSLSPSLREALERLIPNTTDETYWVIPRDPTLADAHDFHRIFELVHQRLAGTWYKWALRSFVLAPFYTILEETVNRRQKISVPLLCNPDGSLLEQAWTDVVQSFLPTRLVDEVVSLLTTIAMMSTHDLAVYEAEWVAEEVAEIDGFLELYTDLRRRFVAESFPKDEVKRRALAETIVVYAKEILSWEASQSLLPHVRYGSESLVLVTQALPLSWPKHLSAGFQTIEKKLQIHPHTFGGQGILAQRRVGITEAAMRLMAGLCIAEENGIEDDEEGKSFENPNNLWANQVGFVIDDREGSYFRITMRPSTSMLASIAAGIRRSDSLKVNIHTMQALSEYTVLLESLRQQLCSGVGLSCPFWDGKDCCRFRPLIERVFELVRPQYPSWARHWQQPICL